MPGHGNTIPKDPAQRIRRNADTIPTTVLTDEGPNAPLAGPPLPGRADQWPEQTQRWWWTWRRSPQAKTFTPTDWDFMIDTALLHARLWGGDSRVAAELRLRVAKFGATLEDRLRLRMQVTGPDDAKPADAEESAEGGRYGHLRGLKATA